MLTHARSNDSSPMHRGRLVRERLLCEPLPPPPAGIVMSRQGSTPTRPRVSAMRPTQCKAMRELSPVDGSIGFAFEHFDGIGRYRADDHGQAIDSSAQILGRSDVKGDFPDLGAMIDKLAQSEQVRGCFARSLLRFAYGLGDDERAECLAKQSEHAFAGTDGSLASLIGVLTSPTYF